MFFTKIKDLKVDYVYAITIKDQTDGNQLDHVIVSRVTDKIVKEDEEDVFLLTDLELVYQYEVPKEDDSKWRLDLNQFKNKKDSGFTTDISDYFCIELGHIDNYVEYLL